MTCFAFFEPRFLEGRARQGDTTDFVVYVYTFTNDDVANDGRFRGQSVGKVGTWLMSAGLVE